MAGLAKGAGGIQMVLRMQKQWSGKGNWTQCNSLFVLPESLKIGFLNTLKETPGTYPSTVQRGWLLQSWGLV